MCSQYESVILSIIGGGSLGFGVLTGCGDKGVTPVCDPCDSRLTCAIPGVFKRTFLAALLAGGVMNPSLCLLARDLGVPGGDALGVCVGVLAGEVCSGKPSVVHLGIEPKSLTTFSRSAEISSCSL
ncbi:hypothetical protein TNCT_61881 [Trichonephila clavata]|uniref:Uncharacterized protein n=1 Tax=Trichonephila clavata TaxID=2740835 RepID=A0A8X6H526_TRICU|nr:hypothetical protein TNCT_61881 [Trichonephila clavata]